MSDVIPFEFIYCPICGGKTKPSDRYQRCIKCSREWYLNAKPCAEVIFTTEDGKGLICIRARDPHKGKYDLCGGFVDVDESFEQALIREINEELGMTEDDFTNLRYVRSAVTTYDYSNTRYQNLVCQYVARLSPDARPIAKDDVSGYKLLTLDELRPEDFAWPELQYTFVKQILG